MKNEFKIFLTALMFYTRIPVPENTGYSEKNLNKASRYFPLIGIIVGGTGALVFWGTNYLFSVQISILMSMGIMILLTGAFHEDALSDFCDGFGGGFSKDKILSIMKDSHIGTYGAIGLIILLLSKFFLLSEFNPANIPLILIVAHAHSRIYPVILIYTSKYVREGDDSKSKSVGKKQSISSLFIAIIFGCMPLLLIETIVIPFLLIANVLIFIFFRYYIHKKIGGYTGDVLGTLQQFTEIGFYLSYLITFQII
ncbi:adenosylcobinamide-GDP ribazoletransferase [Bacteroidota bacterium]